MRLWTVHPKYLDSRGLVALWREALLAQAVLLGRTRGYTHHPQLTRFRRSARPAEAIAAYLCGIYAEAVERGYDFDEGKIESRATIEPIETTQGQLDYEWSHLKAKLDRRSPTRLKEIENVACPEAHPLFRIVPGPVEEWESGARTVRHAPNTRPRTRS